MKRKSNSYLKSITTLMSGSIVAQLFTLICTPVLTRVCSAETLGVYSLVTGAVTIFGMVMSLRYDLCIVTEYDDSKVFPLIKLSVYICLGISVVVFVGYTVYFRMVDLSEDYILLAALTSLLCLMLGIINVLTAYNNRLKQYKLITNTYIARTAGQNICNIIAGFLSMGAVGLSCSQVLGYALGIRGQLKPLLEHKVKLRNVTAQEIKQAASENRKQALISAPAALANGLSYSLINYFIEALFSAATVGYYSISYRILGLPITIISGNVSRVFMEKASREYQSCGNFEKTYKTTLGLLSLIAVPIGAAMIALAPWACELLFGEGWAVAGTYIRLLTPMFMLRFIAGGVNCSAIIVGKQQYDFIIQVILTVSVVCAFISASATGLRIESFLTMINVVFSIVYIIYISLFWKCAKRGQENGV